MVNRMQIPSLIRRAMIYCGILASVVAGCAFLLWHDHPDLDKVGWLQAPLANPKSPVTVTWLGVSTLLFDDGETQILIDGFISRPTLTDVVLNRPLLQDVATINFTLNAYNMTRLAAIIPVHSHFDHAMDIGAIANRSSASVLGSESTAAIARAAGVPDDQIAIADTAVDYEFGAFQVTLRPSVHAPIGWRGSTPLAGRIDSNFALPARVRDYRAGESYSIIVSHPSGTTLIQGSAGFLEGELLDVSADVVMLGVAQMTALGHDYAEAVWQNTVTMTGAQRVFAIHFDNYTRPFGDIQAYPRFLGSVLTTAEWLEAFRDRWDKDTELYLPIFGEKIALYGDTGTES